MEYFAKFSAILGLFFIFYKLFLERETFFNSIRAYFILGIATALVLPLIIIPEYIYIDALFDSQIAATGTAPSSIEKAPVFDINTILLSIYGLGLLFFSSRFLFQLISLFRFILKFPRKKRNGYTFIEVGSSTSPFSFFNYIIYPKNGFTDNELDQIIEHEKIHASQYHSIDILVSQLLIIFNWFNPIAWLYQKEVQKNLEFIADQGAQSIYQDKESYQYLLLKSVTPNYSIALTSNFYNSLTKKRINMLHKNESDRKMYLKFVFILPILIAFVFTFNTKVIAQQKTEEKIEMNTKLDIEVITKDFQKSDLETLKENLSKEGITLQYKKLSYNDNKEIIGIQVSVSNKQHNKTQIEQMGSAPIKPISIKFDDKGALAIGNMQEHEDHNVFVSTNGGQEENVFVFSDGEKSTSKDGNYVWVSKDGKETHVKIVNGNKVIEEIHGPESENVWVSESGDTTIVKKIEIIEVDEMHDGEKKVIVKKIHKDGEDEEIIIKASEGDSKGHGKMMFISEGDDQPLMIVDGKEVEGKKLEDIDTKNIESINVLKGEKAAEEYGDKGKNGVVIIKTKK